MNLTKIVFYLLLLQPILAIAADQPPGPPPAPVKTALAQLTEIAPVIWMPGTVIARQDSRLSADVEGRLNFVVDVGDRIEQGQVVAEVDTRTFQLLQTEAEAAVAQVSSRLEFNERELTRLRKLAQQNNAAKNRLDEVESLRNQARNELNAARIRVEITRDRIRKASLLAPFNGIVTERYKPAGERVDAGDEILRLVNTDSLQIQASVPQSSIYHLKLGDELLAQDSQHQTKCRIRVLVPVGDERSRLYELRLDYQAKEWAPGHLLRVAVPVEKTREVIAVPRDALVIRADATSVFRINAEDIAEQIVVTTGIADGEWIEVIGDVHDGDVVVIRGNERLRPGQTVNILNQEQ